MITGSNIAALKNEKDLQTIGALTPGEMMTLLKEKVITLDLFNERGIHEVTDPADPTRRYCLCRNPQTAQRESETRQRLLDLTATTLAEIAAYKRATTVEKLGARIGNVLAKCKMGKFIQWSIDADQEQATSRKHRLIWSITPRTTTITFSGLGHAACTLAAPGFIHTLAGMHAGSLQIRWLTSSHGNWAKARTHWVTSSNFTASGPIPRI